MQVCQCVLNKNVSKCATVGPEKDPVAVLSVTPVSALHNTVIRRDVKVQWLTTDHDDHPNSS